jgi:hypothetical protein
MEHVQCECGRVMGERCEWTGPRAETVVIEWMPEQHRVDHTRAGNSGSYPYNGAVRLRLGASCAERVAETDGEWTSIVESSR